MGNNAIQPAEVLLALAQKESPRIYLLEYLPRALYGLISSIPMPWEPVKYVSVRYHGSGAVSIVSDRTKMSAKEFRDRWRYIEAAIEDEKPIINKHREDYYAILLKLCRGRAVEINEAFCGRMAQRKRAEKKPSLKGLAPHVQKYLYGTEYSHGAGGKRLLLHDIKLKAANGAKPGESSRRSAGRASKPKICADFYRTELEWTEAGALLLVQGRNLLNMLLRKQGIGYSKVDNSFDYVEGRKITTKERKKSRKGMAFHTIRELLKLAQCVVDAFISYRLGERTALEHYISVLHIFRNVGTYTGIYRYKYKSMGQIKRASNTGVLWCESWRIWCKFFQGHIPFLERNICRLLERMCNGRKKRKKPVTKQRAESQFDIDLKNKIRNEFGSSKRCLQLFNEMWRCWKSDRDLPAQNADLLHRLGFYCQLKAEWYVSEALRDPASGKKAQRKKMGKVIRLYIKNERKRQAVYLENPHISAEYAVRMVREMKMRLENKPKIELPGNFAIEYLKSCISFLVRHTKGDEKRFYQEINVEREFERVRTALLTRRVFLPGSIGIKKAGEYLIWHDFPHEEKVVDAFLAFYLWGEAKRLGIFPKYLYDGSACILDAISAICSSLNAQVSQRSCQFRYRNMHRNIDFLVLSKLLSLIMDPVLVDYVISRMNCTLLYKDMELVVSVGLVRGLCFSSFIENYWFSSIDALHFNDVIIRYNNIIIVPENASIKEPLPSGIGEIECVKNNGDFIIGPYHVVYNNANISEKALIENDFEFYNFEITPIKDMLREQCNDLVEYCRDSSFITIVNKWNHVLWEYIRIYRNYADIKSIEHCEGLIRECIKECTPSKVNARFPEAFFYLPRALGGLGMTVWRLIDFGELKTAVHTDISYPSGICMNMMYCGKGIHFVRKPPIKIPEDDAIEYCRKHENIDRMTMFPALTSYKSTHSNGCKSGCKSENRENRKAVIPGNFWKLPDFKKQTRAQKIGAYNASNRRLIQLWSPSFNLMNVSVGCRERIPNTGIVVFGKMPAVTHFYSRVFEDRLWYNLYTELVNGFRRIFPAGFAGLRRDDDVYEHSDGCYEFEYALDGEMCRVYGNVDCIGRIEDVMWRRMVVPSGSMLIKLCVDVVWRCGSGVELLKMVRSQRDDYFYVIADIYSSEYLCVGRIDEERGRKVAESVERFFRDSEWLRLMRMRISGELGLFLGDF